jgi:hypothetical protein
MNKNCSGSFALPRVAIVVTGMLPLLSTADSAGTLSRNCEIAVARSALPKGLRDGASVYALANGEYELAVQGTGPFTCIVERNHPQAVIPQCMDRAGAESLLPAIMDKSLMTLSGSDLAEIATHEHQMTEDGTYKAPSRAGISYMMSDYNYIFVESAARILKVPPHVMYYAPNLRNEDIGGSLEGATENIGTPFLLGEGIHGMMIVYTEHEADTDEVAEACRGELGEPPPDFNPFPKG